MIRREFNRYMPSMQTLTRQLTALELANRVFTDTQLERVIEGSDSAAITW